MTKKGLKILLAVVIAIFGFSETKAQQERAFHWAFPQNNGLDFSSGNVAVDTSACPSNANGGLTQGTSAISDRNGNLVMYSNGDSVWNFKHDVIQGGAGLAGSEETTQSSMIIPFPSDTSRYYLFTMDDNGGGNGLYNYIIDMSFNSGEGFVLGGNQLEDRMAEKLCAVKHANDYEYWLISHRFDSDSFLVYHVDSFGLNSTPVISKVGLTHSGGANGAMGQMKVSPDGRVLAIAGYIEGHIELFSFDNETGVVSAPLILQNYNQNFPFGVEFSPDSRKLYYLQRFSDSPGAQLIQYDIDHIDTTCLLDSENDIVTFPEQAVPSQLQLATNGKIYMTWNYASYNDTLGVINKPNLYAQDCDFNTIGVLVDSAIAEGLPNFVSSYLSDGIHVEFGTTCEGMETFMHPEDSIGLDSVNWNFGDPTSSSNISSELDASHVFTTSDTFLTRLITFTGSTSDTFYRNIIIWDTAIDVAGNDTTICSGGANAVIRANWYNSCLEWSTGSTADSISVATEGWYWVDVFYQSCYFRDSVYVEEVNGPPQFSLGNDTMVCNIVNLTLDPNLPNVFYTWNDNSHDTTLSVTGSGIYSLTATNACGSTSDSMTVVLNTTASLNIGFAEDTTICDTNTLILFASFPNSSTLWTGGSTDTMLAIDTAGIYTVRVANVCDTVYDTISVEVVYPLISSLISSDLLCSDNDTITLFATATNDSVIWSTSVTDTAINVNSPGDYWFGASNECGIVSDTSRIIRWDTSYSIDLGPDTILCDPSSVVELNIDSTELPIDISWSDGSSSFETEVSAGIHSVTVSNRCVSISDAFRVGSPELIRIEPLDDYSICGNDKIVVEIKHLAFVSGEWSDGQIGANALFSIPGSYTVVITDTNNCTQVDSISLDQYCPMKISVDNIFTPNGDGSNDLFCVVAENAKIVQLSVFNRWGILVHTSTNPSACWDGYTSGRIASKGVYYYLVNAENSDGITKEYRGSFTLLR